MTSLLTRPRAAAAAGIGVAMIASLLAAAPAHAAGPFDDRTVLTQGHADVFYITKDAAGAPELTVHTDEFGNVDPGDALIQLKPSVAARTAGANAAALLGVDPGSTYYQAPIDPEVGQLFLGYGFNTNAYPAGSINVTHTVTDFEGPGTFAAWRNSAEGPVAVLHTGQDLLSFTSPANHAHLAWGFTEEGQYSFDVTSTFTVDGQLQTAGPETYTFYVGETLPEDPGPPPGDVSLAVTGAAAHYHTGNVASLTAEVTGSDESHFHWFTRADAGAEWAVVPGALGSTYGFVVTGEHQVKAVLYGHDHSVLAESEPVSIAIDDHGNTPGIGPELAVSLNPTEGALVISVAPGGERSELSDLTLNAAADRYVSSGEITGVTVTDTRSGELGWQASGRVRELVTLQGAVLDGKYLGWTPKVLSTSGAAASAGAAVAPGFAEGTGIKGWSTLGSAPAGSSTGTSVLGADISVEAPTTTTVGDYTGVVLITVI